jgi:signal transduction histidine kinase
VERDEKARLAVDAERGRIARELHDVVAHGISLIAVQAGAGRHALGDDPMRAQAAFGAIEQTARQALVEMRRMLGLLRDPSESVTAAPLPGIEDIDGLVDQARATGLAVDFEVAGEPTSLPPGVGLTAFRVVQEGLTNVRKHAPGSAASVTVRYEPATLEVIVTDDGPVGQHHADSAGAGGGQGLAGMRERVALYEGRLEVGPRPDGGFSVAASLPLRDEAS